MNYYQIGIFFVQGSAVALLILLLFHLRRKLGIGILFACLGLFQFMQVFLSSTLYVELADNFLVSPGSSVLFTATLFAVLLIYIKEDASETRKIIYALIIVNIVMSFLIHSFGWNLQGLSSYNPFNVSTDLFDNNAWVLFVGTVALFLDSLFIIIIYEFIARRLSNLFLQISLTMLIVVTFDTLFFSYISFHNYDNLKTIVFSGLISKGVFALYYSILFFIYLEYFDKKEFNSSYIKVKDVFKPLSYRQKFEVARLDVIKTSEEARQKETKYQTLTTISPVGIFHTRVDGYTTFVNPKWCEISGLSVDDALGNGWMKAVHPDDVEKVKSEWEHASAEKRVSESDYRFLLNDGSVKWVLGRAVPEYDNQGQIIGYVGTITDITALKIYQQEQIKLKEKAEESNLLKSAFLANMSHEIRTPMNGILGFASLLKDSALTEKDQQNYISIIEKSGERMLTIINDIISISKIESGNINVYPEDVDISEQMEFVFTFFKPEVKTKGLTFTLKNSLDKNDSVISTDREKFVSIISNLIKNSIKYTEKGSIEFGCVKKEGTLEFYVRDSGIGIPEERREAVFERFIQADIEDRMARQGAGLGLSISKAYVELLGGTIRVESEVNKGSVFYFTLPSYTSQKKTVERPASVSDGSLDNKGKQLKILIAEDDDTSRFLLDTLLEGYECSILHAYDGAEAVEICRKEADIDLVFMDIRMPEMNGYEATRKIREFNQELIIIALTAHALAGDKEKALKAGCNSYISKPFTKQSIYSVIQGFIRNRQEEQDSRHD